MRVGCPKFGTAWGLYKEYIHTQKTINFFLLPLENNYKNKIMPGKLGDLIKKVKTRKKVNKYKKDRAENPTVINKPHGGKPGPNQMNFSISLRDELRKC